jgi:DNA-binding SARP family transcriptional activator
VLSSGLRVTLIGRVALVRDGEQLPDLATKPLELLGYLLLHRDRPHPRDGLADLLWPDAGPPVSRKYLRQTLWQLQARLAVALEPGEAPLLDLPPGHVRVNPDASWWCDVDVVEQVQRRCRDLPGGPLRDADVTALEQAVELSRHDLLVTWQHDWVLRERDRLRLVHLDLLERLTDHYAATGNLARGLAHGNRLLQLDPAREVTHRQLMRLYADAGDRTGALRQYRRCMAALATEFDLEPDAETVELYRRIRAGRGVGIVPTVVPHQAATVRKLDERLDEIVAAVAALRSEVRLLVALQRDDPVGEAGEWEAG